MVRLVRTSLDSCCMLLTSLCSRFRSQIRFFLLQNRQGKTRLSKWYVAIDENDKRKIESEVHRLVTSRDSKFTNFFEVRFPANAACSILRGAILSFGGLFPVS